MRIISCTIVIKDSCRSWTCLVPASNDQNGLVRKWYPEMDFWICCGIKRVNTWNALCWQSIKMHIFSIVSAWTRGKTSWCCSNRPSIPQLGAVVQEAPIFREIGAFLIGSLVQYSDLLAKKLDASKNRLARKCTTLLIFINDSLQRLPKGSEACIAHQNKGTTNLSWLPFANTLKLRHVIGWSGLQNNYGMWQRAMVTIKSGIFQCKCQKHDPHNAWRAIIIETRFRKWRKLEMAVLWHHITSLFFL